MRWSAETSNEIQPLTYVKSWRKIFENKAMDEWIENL